MTAALSALVIWLLGGVRTASVSATDPWRALMFAFAGAIAYFALSGPSAVRRDLRAYGRRFVTPLALLLALSPIVAGLARNSWTAGGADSYGYVSQADLWLHFRLKTPVPVASFAPWPNAIWTFTPHGYRPAPNESALVPSTAPGLPLMMAAAKMIGGHCTMFWVTPLFGGLLVWLTFAIGRKLGSASVGLAAAWLVATSPAVLAMLMSPMSDVPAAALWALAILLVVPGPAELRPCKKSEALAAGLSASAAILVRPNLAPLAVVLAVWTFAVRRQPHTAGRGRTLLDDAPAASAFGRTSPMVPTFFMVAGILPGVLLIAFLNDRLYGSPLSSGYGSVDTLFSLANVGINFRQYSRWLVESQTPLALLGIAALALPTRSIWPTRAWQRTAWLLACVVLVVWALYLIYTPFDAWWYLRFLLPCWPAICLGTAALIVRLAESRPVAWRLAALALLVCVGAHGIYFANRYGAFPSGEGDHRYVSIAKLVEYYTDPRCVIITGQNAGPTRYYGGRATLRFDLLDDAWLDRAVAWLANHDRHPYFLLEEWEVPAFQQRFARTNKLGALGLAPVLAYHAPGVPGSVLLFDPERPDGPTVRPVPPRDARPKCVEPEVQPALN